MTRRKQSRGKCGYCGREFAKGGTLRHLTSCARRKEIVAASDRKRGRKIGLTHLRVTDSWSGDFWLDLEMKGSATLRDLDRYLRYVWLECCGHLSMFTTGGWGEDDEISMETRVDRALQPGVQLVHINDFGTSSETLVRSVFMRNGRPTISHSIALMARNNSPEPSCMACEQTAVRICIECVYEDDRNGMLCQNHEATHPHEDYGGPLPVVNSPRMGMCGYDGPAEPPY